jgi:1-acyl-sn-glycerol-3-phosphate acyltransferase
MMTVVVRKTIFDTPILNLMLHWLALLLLRIFGWQTEGDLPTDPKYVMVAAPHSSNWDFLIVLALAFSFRSKIFWLGKHTVFRRPFAVLFNWLGGIPVDRTQSEGMVAKLVQAFHDSEQLVIVIAPEGTRKRPKHWKTGFYHIAVRANVPIVLGFIDYKRRVGGIGPTIIPTGDFKADMKELRFFYSNVVGKNPDKSDFVAAAPENQQGTCS